MYCTIIFCSVLYYTVIYQTALKGATQNCTLLYCTGKGDRVWQVCNQQEGRDGGRACFVYEYLHKNWLGYIGSEVMVKDNQGLAK